MANEKTIGITEAARMWREAHPEDPVTRQTIVNWSRRYGFIMNPERIVKHAAIKVDAAKFRKFSEAPEKFLAR